MVFSTKKRTGRFIKTGYNRPDIFMYPPAELETLIGQLQSGEATAIEPLIKHHIRLAVRIAGQYSNTEDMVAIAVEAVVDVCFEVFQGRELIDNNLTGAIISRINSRCNRARYEDHTVRIPMSSRFKNAIEQPEISNDVSTVKREPFDYVEFYDFIASCCETDQERVIIKLREQSYNNTEIGDILGLSKMWVGTLLAKVRTRYYTKLREL